MRQRHFNIGLIGDKSPTQFFAATLIWSTPTRRRFLSAAEQSGDKSPHSKLGHYPISSVLLCVGWVGVKRRGDLAHGQSRRLATSKPLIFVHCKPRRAYASCDR